MKGATAVMKGATERIDGLQTMVDVITASLGAAARDTPAIAAALEECVARELAAGHAAMDAKEAELDAHGYGGKPAGGEMVGLGDARTPVADPVLVVLEGISERLDEILAELRQRRR